MIARAAQARFALILFALITALMGFSKPIPSGDIAEYALTMIAIDAHGTPDVRHENVSVARAMIPMLAEQYDMLEQDMRIPDKQVFSAFVRGREGKVYAIHFFGYSLLATLPYKLTKVTGLAFMTAFQIVNAVFVFILGLSLFRVFRSEWKALFSLGLFMLCGGLLYFRWTSPEITSAAGLLAALLLFCSGAPVRGALLAGLASQQNPTIVAFFGFAPLLLLSLKYRHELSLRSNVMALASKRQVVALAAGLAVFAMPVVFNLYQYGVPNIIARHFSDPAMISLNRLVSFYFDLNQGMVVALPGVLLMLAVWAWTSGRRNLTLLGLAMLFTLALALPALAVYNWNSAADGVMRYAFWASMPLLFALLWRLRQQKKWPLMLGAVAALQALAMYSATSYTYVQFSPLAQLVIAHAPRWYHPEPEIFVERTEHHDRYYSPDKIYVHSVGGKTVTTLYNADFPGTEERLCGSGQRPARSNDTAEHDRGWRYLHGAVQCKSAADTRLTFRLPEFRAAASVRLDSGWYNFEAGGNEWDGAWSAGKNSRILVTLPSAFQPSAIYLLGTYFAPNTRTRVSVNGVDLGWHGLNEVRRIAFSPSIVKGGQLLVELEHEAPRVPEQGGDTREITLFLRSLVVEAPAL